MGSCLQMAGHSTGCPTAIDLKVWFLSAFPRAELSTALPLLPSCRIFGHPQHHVQQRQDVHQIVTHDKVQNAEF